MINLDLALKAFALTIFGIVLIVLGIIGICDLLRRNKKVQDGKEVKA